MSRTTIEAVARAAQDAVNQRVQSDDNEALIIGGVENPSLCGIVGNKRGVWPREADRYYVVVSVPVGAGKAIPSAGILTGITVLTAKGTMA